MNKIFQIGWREYQETIKTRTFLLSLFIMPLMIIIVTIVSDRAARSAMTSGARSLGRVAVVDRSGQLGAALEASFKRFNESFPQRSIAMVAGENKGMSLDQQVGNFKEDVRRGRLTACVEISAGITSDTGSAAHSQVFVSTRGMSDMALYSTVQRLLNEAVVNRRCAQHQLSPQLIAQINRPVTLDQVEISRTEDVRGQSSQSRMMIPFFFMFLMFMGIITTSQGLLLSVIEEKNSRVIEVLLAAVSPFVLMAGKILGLAAVGFTLMAIWGGVGLGAAHHFGLRSILSHEMMVWFLIYYILGYVMISSMYAAIGSACNTIKEAQNLLMPITMLTVLPMMFWMPISQNPMGTWATALAFFPPTTPMIMVLRLSVQPDLPLVQIIGSLILLLAATAGTFWVAGKIFRVGILMYGKPPTPREMLRWMQYR